MAAMWMMWFIRRFPARDRRCRTISPEEASIGAVPVQDANRLRSANLATSPVSAKVRAATTGPNPGRSINLEPEANTISFSSRVRALIFFSTAASSTICSAASRRRVLPATSRGLPVASIRLAWAVVMSLFDYSGTSSDSSRQPAGAVAAPHRPHPLREPGDAFAHLRVPPWSVPKRPVATTVSRSSTTSMVADSLWVSTPMTNLAMSFAFPL